jgi:type IV pilus assembly protein PilE
MFRSNTQSGVTLVELMTVVVIVTILASVAIPSYRSYLIRTQRSDAKTALLNLRAAQEKFYLQNNAYSDKITDPSASGGLGLRSTSDNGFYTLSVDLGTGADEDSNQGYTASATPVEGRGQTEDEKCLVMTLTDVGLRGASGSGGPEYCWR